MSHERLVHHELCFGCGRTNLFGLLLDVQPTGERQVHARGFVKQDHQGAVRGTCHEGVILAALSDAMALAGGPEAQVVRLEAEFPGRAPVGSFIEIDAEISGQGDEGLEARATGSVDGQAVARAHGVYRHQ